MSSSKIKGLTVEIGGDATPLSKALKKPNAEASTLQGKLKEVNKLLKMDPSNTELLAQKQRILSDAIGANEKKLKLLKSAQEQFVDSGKNVDSAEYIELQKQISLTEKKLKTLESQQNKFSAKLQSFGNAVGEFGKKSEIAGKKMAGASTAAAAGLAIVAKKAIDWETAWAGVLKTVDGTPEQLAKIEKGLKDLATQTDSSKEDIAGVAEAAGQLGIATDDILDFTKTMIQLGDTTNLSASEAASALAKFANITKTSPKDYGRLGSSIVDLGNNFATTEADIVAMATRLASTGELVGLSEADILGLATALSSVGIEAEAGGSAFSKLLKSIQLSVELGGEKLKQFASVSGVSTAQFKKAFKDDAAGAVAMFVQGLNDTERNGMSAIAVLDDMGFKEVRLSNSILSLASNSDLLNKALSTSSNAWDKNTALQDEAQKRYETTAARLNQLKEEATNLAVTIGDALLPVIKSLTNGIKNIIEWLNGMDETTRTIVVAIGVLVAAIAPVLITVGKVAQGISRLIEFGGKLAPLFTKIAKVAKSAFGLLKTVITGAFNAIMAHPIVAAIAAVIAIIVLLYTKCEWFRDMINIAIQSVIGFFQGFVDSIAIFFTEIIPQKINEFISFFTSIPEKIGELIQSIIEWFNQLPYKLGYVVGQIIGHIIQFGLDLYNFVTVDIPEFIEGVIEWFKQLPGKIWEQLVSAWNYVCKWGSDTYNSAKDWVSKTIDNVVSFFKSLPGKIWTWLCNAAGKVASWGIDLFNKGKEAAGKLVKAVVDGVKSLPGKMLEIGKNIVSGIWDGISGGAGWLMDKIGEFASGVVDGIKDFFGIHSPSRVMRDIIGKNMVAGMGVGITKNKDLLLNPLSQLVKETKSTFDPQIAATINKSLSHSEIIKVESPISIDLDGKPIYQNVITRITKNQTTSLRFKGA